MNAMSQNTRRKLWNVVEGQFESFKLYRTELSSGRMRINYGGSLIR
jgi:hypothetical protein